MVSALEGALIDFDSDCVLPVSFSYSLPVSPASTKLLDVFFLPCLPLLPPACFKSDKCEVSACPMSAKRIVQRETACPVSVKNETAEKLVCLMSA